MQLVPIQHIKICITIEITIMLLTMFVASHKNLKYCTSFLFY